LLFRERSAERRYEFVFIRMEIARHFHLAVNQSVHALALY